MSKQKPPFVKAVSDSGTINLEKANALLKEGEDVNAVDNFQNTVLHLAIEKYESDSLEHLPFIKWLIDNGADLKATNINDETPFHWAALKNKWELIEYLIEHGSEVNATNRRGNTALHLAVENNCLKTVAILHKYAGSQLREDIRNENYFSPVDIAEKEYHIHERIKEILQTEPNEYRKACMEEEHKLFAATGQRGNVLGKPNEPNLMPGSVTRCQDIPRNVPATPHLANMSFSCEEVYEMANRPRGLCIIISNTDFKISREQIDESNIPRKSYKDSLDDRVGADIDISSLDRLFESFHFIIHVFKNLTAVKMFDHLRYFSRWDHSMYSCFVCCILSHGCARGIYGVDGKPLNVVTITGLFSGNICTTLADKPKLFFFQACRGLLTDSGYVKDGPTDEHVPRQDNCSWEAEEIRSPKKRSRNTWNEQWTDHWKELKETSPQEADFFVGFPTPLGYLSWRQKDGGSWFIEKLCEIFLQYANREHLMELITRVNNEVAKLTTHEGNKQIPHISFTLRKMLYFFPDQL